MRHIMIALCGLALFAVTDLHAQTDEGTGDVAPVAVPALAAQGEGTGAAAMVDDLQPPPGEEAADEAPAAAGIGVVRVQLVGEENRTQPLGGVSVTLEPIGVARPSMGQILQGTTGPDGLVAFDLPEAGMTYRATAHHNGLAFNATGPVRVGAEEPVGLAIYEMTSDPAALRAMRVIVMMSLHEEYLVVEQHFSLVMEGPYVYRSGDEPTAGLEIRFPEGVEGIRILEPREQGHVVAGDTGILVRGPIGPENSLRSDGPFVTVRYSLPNTSETFRYEQPMPFPVDDAIILVPQVTEFDRFPTIDIDLMVPHCEQGARPEETVCFGSTDSDQPPLALLPGVDRREVWGGVGEAGAVLRFDTRGWPSYSDPLVDAALYGSILVALVGVFLIIRQARRRSEGDDAGPTSEWALERARVQLLEELLRVRAEYEEGYLPKSEFETTELIIRNRLEAVYTAMELEPDDEAERPDGGESRS